LWVHPAPDGGGFHRWCVFGASSTFADAGPWSSNIAQFEMAIRQSAGNPFAGLAAPQSISAQIDREPTVASMKNAERALKSRANRLDVPIDRAGCERALSEAKRMYIL
jgi:hypothetical protein